jgi:choline kinase
MKVIMKHISGTAKANLARAQEEMIRVLGFRGDVVSAKVKDQRIILKIKINPEWDSPDQDKGDYLKGWIHAKVKSVFEVISISE